MKRPRFFIGLLAVALALGIIGGAVLGRSANADGDSDGTHQSFASRVANILGLAPDKVQEAFDEARRDQQDERLQRHLDQMVEAEKLEPQDDAAIMKWFQERPDAAMILRRGLLYGAETVQKKLDYLVERGRLSEDEAQAVMTWYQQRPAVLDDLLADRQESKEHFQKRFHRGDSDNPQNRFKGRRSEGLEFRFHRGDTEGNQFRFRRGDTEGNQFRFRQGDSEGNQFRFRRGGTESYEYRFHRGAPPTPQDRADGTSL